MQASYFSLTLLLHITTFPGIYIDASTPASILNAIRQLRETVHQKTQELMSMCKTLGVLNTVLLRSAHTSTHKKTTTPMTGEKMVDEKEGEAEPEAIAGG